VGVDAVAKVARIIRADHSDGGRDTLLVLVGIINQDMDGRPGNRDVANAEFRVVNPTLGAEVFREDVLVARHAGHDVFRMTAHLQRFVASPAIPFDGVVKLSEIHGGGNAACSGEVNFGAFFSGRLHTAVRTPKTQVGILFKMVAAKILRLGVVHARHASQVIDIAAASRVHLETSIVLPRVDNTGLRVVGRPAVSDCSWVVDTGAVLRRGLNATLFGTDRLNDDAELGIVGPMCFAEVLREDALSARSTLQRVPVTAEDVRMVAS
jgi:hypothetical protein